VKEKVSAWELWLSEAECGVKYGSVNAERWRDLN